MLNNYVLLMVFITYIMDCLNFINVIFHREVLMSDLLIFCLYFLFLVQEILL